MIRPFTLVCMLLACASGLYLYQAKHRVLMLDRQISLTVQATTAARDRAGMLRTEWALLNDLERLRLLADQFLKLKSLTPGQFTSFAELPNRLPAIRAPEPEPVEATPVIAQETVRPVDPAPAAAARPTMLPAAEPKPKPAPTRLASVQTVAARPQPAPVHTTAFVNQTYVRPAPREVVTAFARSRPADAPIAASGSSLGMARTALPPPVPFAAGTAWVSHDGN